MPRVRKFEDDLVMQAYPEGQMIFEGQGVRLLKSRENTDIILIESVIEGRDFVGYVEDTCETLKYTSKLKAGTGYMCIQHNYDDMELEVLFFRDFKSDEHDVRRVSIPIEKENFFSSSVIPVDENHLLYAISERCGNHRNECVTRCYLSNVLTGENRKIGEYECLPLTNSNFIILIHDSVLHHYNFSKDDMKEEHDPDIERMNDVGLHSTICCYNADCVCFVSYSNGLIEEMIVFDCQRNHLSLTERFPQLKKLNIDGITHFSLFSLTQDCFFVIFFYGGSKCSVVHIENGHLNVSNGEIPVYNLYCSDWDHLDLTEAFNHESYVFYGTSSIGVYGPIKYRSLSSEMLSLSTLQPKKIFFDGVAKFCNNDLKHQYFLNFKENRIDIFRNTDCIHNVQILFNKFSDQLNAFCVISPEPGGEQGPKVVNIHWKCSKPKPIVSELPYGGSHFVSIVLGLPFSVDHGNNNSCLVFLGDTVILELPQNSYVNDIFGTITDNYLCIFCTDSVHFFQLLIGEYGVEVQKHFILDHNGEISYVQCCVYPTATDHQLFVLNVYGEGVETQHLHCLDWTTGNFLKPILLYRSGSNFDQATHFRNFIGDSCLLVNQGIVKVFIVDETITSRFFANSHLSLKNLNFNLNLPKNIVQAVIYEAEARTMILKTYNIEEDPESMNPTVETFHLPSFLAEASIVEYHIPELNNTR
ncbi:hypothetical protein PCE1_002746 [Barthelona sp. PCE]